MPELPEITARAREMRRLLVGKTISGIEVLQPKCLNVSKRKFVSALKGARILDVTNRGKWLFVLTSRGYLLLNMGMGGELLLVDRDNIPEKRRMTFEFKDKTALSVNFWWFGYAHYVAENALDRHAMTAKLGPNALDVTVDDLRGMLKGRKGRIKSFLLNQERIAGIGNAYVHDILFLARLHPLRAIDTLTDDEIGALSTAIRDGLRPSLKKGGAFYETSLRGKPGRFGIDDILIGYKAGKPCPVCGGKITKIKTGSTSSFICRKCQPLKPTGAKRGRTRKGK
jgi:formamidopyrimidine-DNA glycosylase